ncbi:integral membrane protein [Diaporthe helianthi]|uniref:Integral membrane protein n=1 Tax=Diaporthe helianthi TaxID=158607 RepID=A0A2P5HUW5_DIAHE|nr:integral membrane protein [Diaporthe helianthi]
MAGNWYFMLLLPFDMLFGACVLTTKLSVLFFYKRVFTSRAMRIATLVTLVLVVLWGIGNLLQSFLVCHIIDGTWHATNPNFCPNLQASFISIGMFNLITNTIIMLVPLHTVWTLQKVNLSTRLGLSAVFLLNLVVIVVSVTRIALMIDVKDINGVLDSMVVVTFISVLEVNLSILCNSLPMLLPLYAYWKHRRFGGGGEDEYVSRLRGDSLSGRHEHLVENLTNGIPLETIYGKDNVHFTTTVGRGDMSRRTNYEQSEDDGSDSESTRRLPRNAQAITIETKWSITEETVK